MQSSVPESGQSGPGSPPPGTGADGDPRIAALRERGAQCFDPVAFCHLEALARRTAVHAGAAGRVLDGRLADALAALTARYDAAQAEAARALVVLAERHPDAAEALNRLHADGDLRGLRRLAVRLDARAGGAALRDLMRHIDHLSAAPAQRLALGPLPATSTGAAAAAPMGELKALSQSRSTWSRLRVERQLSRSLAAVPDRPGPLNSQLLVLRALRLMQDIAPAYLDRFMSYVDALAWLDDAQAGAAGAPGLAGRREGDRKRGPSRGKSR